MICISSFSVGYPMIILYRNRSTCASGRGYVPRFSTGFCVAITKKGTGRGKVWFPIVTCRSCIASSSALCTFGGALFISSASTKFAKTGPFTV